MNNHKLLKIAGVLLLSALLLFSATAVTANTNEAATSIRSIAEPNNAVTPTQNTGRDTLYDNGLTDGLNGLSCVAFPGYNREIIDDFVVPGTWQVTGGEYYVLTNSGTTSVNGCIVSFFQDTGGPSTTAYATKTAAITCTLTGMTYFGRPEIKVTCSFDAVTLAPGTWWICFQTQHTENVFSMTATVKGSSVFLSFPDQAYPRWTNGYVVFAAYYDLAWALTGTGGGGDTTPPETICTLTGTMNGTVYISDVTVTLTATDDSSGVNYTRYKVDDGAWVTYTTPFVVSANGAHTVLFYSVDFAGNQEAEKTSEFTIQKPVAIVITIKGGFGVSAVIKNTGTTDLTNVAWTISLNGGFILLGKTKSGEIPSIATGAEVTVKDIVFGIGKPTITVSAGTAEVTATGTVFLFFVIGVA
ncbi:MAG: hypothetical protein IMZ53_14895 [Thermoplasmata archaeon]|nr:hypothetical protein [Thermoplasmata archaeon]MBE3141861.1 hypothetical protein [Thermoplasmata archaeon]